MPQKGGKGVLHSPGLAVLGIAVAVCLVVLMRASFRSGGARVAARRDYFDECLPLFAAPVKTVGPDGFARVSGRYEGQPFDLQVLPDTLSYRKLPSLWLMITLRSPMPVGAVLDVMRRPTGREVFSQWDRLPVALEALPYLPADTGLRSDRSEGQMPESILQQHAALFDQPQVKELLVTPNGLRLVILAEEADRARYLLFRDAEMGAVAQSQARLRPFLDRLLTMAQELHDIEPAKTKRIA